MCLWHQTEHHVNFQDGLHETLKPHVTAVCADANENNNMI